jgi:hypothetical protein
MQGSDWEKGVRGVKGQISGSRRSTEVEIYPEMCITSGHLEHRWVSHISPPRPPPAARQSHAVCLGKWFQSRPRSHRTSVAQP